MYSSKRSQAASGPSIGLRKFLESSEEKTIQVAIFVSSANALWQILKLSTNKGNRMVEPVIITVFVPFVLVADNRHIKITTILKIDRSKLSFFANKGTISDPIHFYRLMMHGVHSQELAAEWSTPIVLQAHM
jgi:hypothetical protein